MTVRLILGGARSGKSSFAEQLAKSKVRFDSTKVLHYIATAIAFDEEMEARIQHHQHQRGKGWIEHECPYELAQTLEPLSSDDVVLVDCLTLWLNNVIYNHGHMRDSKQIDRVIKHLIDVLKQSRANITLVSNEVGMGLTPEGEVSHLFIEHAGLMNQWIGDNSTEVIFVAAGLTKVLKGPNSEL